MTKNHGGALKRFSLDLLLLLLFCVPMAVLIPANWMWFATGLFLLILLPGASSLILVSSALLSLFLFSEIPGLKFYRFGPTVAALALLGIYAWSVRRVLFLRRAPLATFLCFMAVFTGGVAAAKTGIEFTTAFLVVVARVMWSAVLVLGRWDERKNLVQAIPLVSPFWWDGRLPFLMNTTQRAESADELLACRIGAVKLLLWLCFLALLRDAFLWSLFRVPGQIVATENLPSFALRNLYGLSFRQIVDSSATFRVLWLYVLARGVDHLLFVAAIVGKGVALAMFTGYRIPKLQNAPMLASAFREFFTRVNFYYNRLLVEVFFYPIYRRLPRSLSKRGRAAAGIFLTLVVGGLLYRLSVDVAVLVTLGFREIVIRTLFQLLLFVVLGALLAVSVFFQMGHSRASEPGLKVLVPKRIAYFLLYTVAIAPAIGWFSSDWTTYDVFESYGLFLRRLFLID